MGSSPPAAHARLARQRGCCAATTLQLLLRDMRSLSSEQAGAPEANCGSQCCAEKRVVADSGERGARGRGHCL